MKKFIFLIFLVAFFIHPVSVFGDMPDAYQSAAFWCKIYDIPCDAFQNLVTCESHDDASAVNYSSGAEGAFQFMPSTFIAEEEDLNNDPNFAPGLASQGIYDPEYGNLWNPWAAAHIASHAIYEGRGWQWTCWDP